jgi:hypothetical protein
MPQYPAKDYIQCSGKIEVLVAVPYAAYALPNWPFPGPVPVGAPAAPAGNAAAYIYLLKLGELVNDVKPRRRKLLHKVPGDRHGGPEGDSIETQRLGHVWDIDLSLSRWDPDVLNMLESDGGLNGVGTGNGKVPLNTVGALTHRDRSFRLLLYGLRDATLTRNYPCCVIEQNRSVGMSSKWSELQLGIVAHRAPEGHWGVQVSGELINGVTDLVTGYVDNADTTGVATPYVPS